MSRKPPSLDGAGGPQFDELVEERLDLSPADSAAEKIVSESVALIATVAAPFVHPLAPALVEIFKSVASVLGFAWQRRKAERSRDLILGLYQRLEGTRSRYPEKEEFLDLFEDVLRRTAEQPDQSRRESMQRIFLKIVDEPREHVENRLLLRLADELPVEALQLLQALRVPAASAKEYDQYPTAILSPRLGVDHGRVRVIMTYLKNENLIVDDFLSKNPQSAMTSDNNTLMHLLTDLGRTFVTFAQG